MMEGCEVSGRDRSVDKASILEEAKAKGLGVEGEEAPSAAVGLK